MKTTEKLSRWLGGERNYAEGVAIFRELNIQPKMNAYLDVPKPDKMRVQMLHKQLVNYARIHKVPSFLPAERIVPIPGHVKVNPSIDGCLGRDGSIGTHGIQVDKNSQSTENVIQRPRIDRNPHIKYDELPANLKVLFDESGRLNNEIRTLHTELKAIACDESKQQRRADLAKGIVGRSDTVRKNWEAIDAWWADNQKPVDPIEQAKKEALDQQKRIEANLNYIRRFYGKEKQKNEVARRMEELDKLGVSYEKLVTK